MRGSVAVPTSSIRRIVTAFAALSLALVAGCATEDPDTAIAGEDGEGDEGTSQGADGEEQSNPYFEGETITFVVAASPGGGNDFIAQTIQRFLPQYIPGEPTIQIEHMPGAGGILGMNYVAKSEPDGLTWNASFGRTNTYSAILGEDTLEFDMADLSWVGKTHRELPVLWSRSEAFADLDALLASDQQMRVGGPSPTHGTVMDAKGAEMLLDVDFEIILGYEGSSDQMLDVERGVLDGRASSWSSIMAAHSEWLDDDFVVPLLLLEAERRDILPDTPALTEVADMERPESESILRAMTGPYTLSRSLVGPAGVPAEVLEVMRDAYAKMSEDPDFIREIEGDGYESVLTSGEELGAISQDLMADPRVADIVGAWFAE